MKQDRNFPFNQNQKQEAVELVQLLRESFDVYLERVYRDLRIIVRKAQNPAPEGQADGSLNESEWLNLRNILQDLARLKVDVIEHEIFSSTKLGLNK